MPSLKVSGTKGKTQIPVKMIELYAGWNDLGIWDDVWQVGKQDQDGNITSRGILLASLKNSLVHAISRVVSARSVENLSLLRPQMR